MIAQLTRNERQLAILISLVVAVVGLMLGIAGRNDPIGLHGALIFVAGLLVIALIGRDYLAPEPSEDRLTQYYDDPTRAGIVLAMIWVVFGLAIGDWVAWQLVEPDLTFGQAWSSFGRLRPVHTTAVIFGFGGNGLIATSLYVLQRTSRARLPDQLSPWFVLVGYNLFCVLAVTGYLMGITQSKEYAEPEWYADIWLVIVWVVYFLIYLRTLARRKEPHIYVSNWYYMAFILVVAMLHIVNNLAVPVSLGHAKSYSLFSGVQDAMTQWWYGHNAVAFFLTAGFLGIMYYFIPKAAGRPVYSYRLSIVHFWSLTFLYVWVGAHHLMWTALPDWTQFLGMAFSIMLWMPSWGGMINGIMTLSGAWDKLRTDPGLRFSVTAVAFYGMSTFEGPLMAIRDVNALSHYTDWTIGHVHSGALGWVMLVSFGALYYLVPALWRKPGMYSVKLMEWHYWLAMTGIMLYIFAMWIAGITQGLMWRAYDEHGFLQYSFVESVAAMHPYYVMRMTGGLFILTGALLMAYNSFRTIVTPVELFRAARGRALGAVAAGE